jgi:hypothetical protein
MKFYVLQFLKIGGNILEDRRISDAETAFLDVCGSKVGDAPECPVCGAAVEMLPLLPPIRLV